MDHLKVEQHGTSYEIEVSEFGSFNDGKDQLHSSFYFYKQFYKTKYPCSLKTDCFYRLHLWLYPLLQWLSLMYNDRNHFIEHHCCEFCGEPFHLYERIVFPQRCKSHPLQRIADEI